MTHTQLAPPPRGTRPANRRELLRVAAAHLFASAGYANVSMAEVAAAVNMSASSVYKHFAGKADLLFAAIDAALDATAANLPQPGSADLPTIGRALAGNALDNRVAGALLQRELRHLAPDALVTVRRKASRIARQVAAELLAARPGMDDEQAMLLAHAAIDVVASVSFHHLELRRPHFDDVLGDLATRVLQVNPATGVGNTLPPRRSRPTSRADEILDAAIALFAARGYAEVGIEDIGAAVGITGPSLYNHFAGKEAILATAMLRGHDQLRSAMRAARGEPTPTAALRRVTGSYVELALDRPDLIVLLLSETAHLQGTGARKITAAQRAYVGDWVKLLQAHNPETDRVTARIKVQAAQMLANSISRTPRLRRVPGLRATIHDAAWIVQQ